jgi:general secretion pathway protein D
MNIPVQSGNDPEKVTPGDDMVTHVIAVRFANAAKLKEELSDLVPSYADLAANAETNALIITDTTANVRRFIEIVRALDTQMSAIAEVKVFRLKYSDAANTARLINEVFQPDEQRSSRRNQQGTSPIERMMSFRGGGGSRGRGGDESQDEASPATRIVASADEYTNTLVVAGPAETLGLIETVVKELDSNPLEEQSVMVYPLQNAQAENLKDVMNNLFQQMAQLLYQGGGVGGSLGRGGGGSSRFGGRSQMGFSSGRSSGSSALSGAGNLAGQVYFESDEDTNSLLVITASKNFDKVKKIIAELDKPVPQVLIKVLIAEVTHDESLDLGTEFSMINITHTGNSITTSSDFNIAAQTGGLVVAGIQGDLDVTLRALETQGKLNILSRPYILTSNNQTATINVGEEVPFIRNTTYTETGQTRNTIEYEDIGIILEVTPSINPEGLVIMDVKPEISAITGITVPISETVDAPVFAKRSAESRVAIRDGQTIVIGGLVQDKETESIKKVPLLGDIPLLGLLFQRRETEKQKTELLIFLTPHVAMKDMELNKITDQEKAKSNLFKDPSQSPLFEEHIKAMLQEDLSQPNENDQ